MSRNSNRGNSGCIGSIFVGLVILAIIGALSNAIGPTATLIVIGVVIAIIVLVVTLIKKSAEEENKRQAIIAEQKAKEQAAEAERQRNLSIINAVEQKPRIPHISNSMS